MNIKMLIRIPMLILILTSCIEYKYSLNNDPYKPGDEVKEVKNKIKPGDWITIKTNDRYFSRLQVVEIDEEKVKVNHYTGYREYSTHEVYLKYIQKITLDEIELVYPIGGPLTAILVIFYLLV